MFTGIVKSLGFQGGDAPEGPGGTTGAVAPLTTAQLLRLQQTVLEKTANAVVITDRRGIIRWTNPAFTILTGYSAEEAIGGTPRLLKSGRHDAEFYRELWDTVIAGETWRGDVANRRKDGSIYYGEQVIAPVSGDDGDITHFVAVMNDVTVRREAENARRAAHQQLQHLLVHGPAVLYAVKLGGEKVTPYMISENIVRLLGFTVAESLSHEWWLAQLHPEDRERALASNPGPTAQATSRIEYRLRHKDGSYRWVDDNRRLVRDASGAPAELIGSWTDITERRNSEEVLRGAAARRPQQQARRIAMDFGIIAVASALIFAGESIFGWFEPAFTILADHATHPLADEVTLTAAFLMVAMAVFSFRRWRESRTEAMSQHHLAEAMHTLHGELDARVRQRTVELAQANQGLRTEVAERTRAEQALATSEAQLANALKMVNAGHWEYDVATNLFTFNDHFYAALRTTAEREGGYTITPARYSERFLLPEEADLVAAEVGKAIAATDPHYTQDLEHRVNFGDGTLGRIAVRVFIAKDSEGRTSKTYGVNQDVTQRHRTQEALRESQALYRSLVDTAPTGIFVNVGGKFAYLNATMGRILGAKSAEQLLGTMTLDRVHPDSREAIRARIARGQAGESVPLMDQRYLRLDGSVVEVETTATPITFQGKPAIQVIVNDVSRRKRAEEEGRANETRYRSLFGNMLNGFAHCRMIFEDGRPVDYTYVSVNAAFEKLTGLHGVVGKRASEVMPGIRESDPALFELYGRVASGDGPETNEIFLAALQHWFDISAYSPAPGEFVAVFDVITDRKRAEVTLREAEAQFRDLAENIHEVFWLATPGSDEIQYVSPGYERIWGRTCASLRASPREWIDAIHPDDRDRISRAVGKMAAGLYDEEYRIVRPDGSLRWIRDRAFPVSSERGEIHRLAGLAEDITERKRAEARLRLQHVVTQLLSEAGSSERVNQRILETIARDLDWDVGELWLVDRAKQALRCVENAHPAAAEFGAFARASRELSFASGTGLPGRVWQEGRTIWVSDVQLESDCPRRALAEKLKLRSWVGFPIKRRDQVVGVVGFFSAQVREPDEAVAATLVTLGSQFGQFLEKQQLTEQFQQAQKMEALGTLAGGIAHDFNNIIAGIAGYTELAKMSAPQGTEVIEHLDAVLKCSGRAANLVKQILAFSRHEEHERHPIQLRHIVSEAMHLLRATIPTTIAFESSFAHNLPTVLADANQVHQIVMNLGSNAWHAMRGGAGRLGARLETFEVDAAIAEIHPGLKPGRYVRLSVSDTGHGMDEATVARIFDPFFTTKGPGEGTGLGLAVVHGIMQSHEGVITVYSRPGEGTIFHLYFPCSEVAETGEKTAEVPIPQGHGERVLYVDDEPLLARMSQCALAQLGYEADIQTDPVAALELLRRDPHGYDLVITDLTMPSLSGTEFAEDLLKLRPDLPIILVTGYAAGLTVGQVRALGIREFLLKPHSVHALGHAVARAFAAKSNLRHA